MYINSLTLKNFRNWTEETITFDSGINVLVGANAQGKTNCAEAVFLLCTGYSPRASKDKIFIKNGQTQAEIEATASSNYGTIKVKMVFDNLDKKHIFINGVKSSKIGDLLGNISSVFFNPQDLKLVQETPEDRRRFLNISLSQMNKTYFYALARYNKILAQRNNLLKEPDFDLVVDTLPVWDESLVKQASKIILARNNLIEEIAPIAREKHLFLTDGREELDIKIDSAFYGTAEKIEKDFYNALRQNVKKDIKLGFTTIGPHRDDIKFILNGQDVKVYGSQGQQRTVALSLKLAETEIFYKNKGEYPVLILDDVLSELDKSRQRKLINECQKMQTIFTTTYLDRSVFKGNSLTRIDIVSGKLKKPKISKGKGQI